MFARVRGGRSARSGGGGGGSSGGDAARSGLTPLVPNGGAITVTRGNFARYRALLLNFQRDELESAVVEVRNGLAQIVPLAALRPFAPAKLAELALGVRSVDLALLRETTEHAGCTPATPAVRFLWRVLADLDASQQVTFLRFVSGRSRLPPRTLMARSNQHLRIKLVPLGPTESASSGRRSVRLPVSHTCMFQLDLPQYRSYDETKERLVFALLNCIDFGLA
jgi:E3 ubiquitin-protein ligase HERC1